jgi:thiol-disulfide isomerase/thioredoxin
MRRWVLAAAAGSCLAAFSVGEDPKQTAPPKAEAKPADTSPLKVAFDKYQEALKEKVGEARKATPANQKELFSEIREFQVIELDKLFELAEKEPTTQSAFTIFAELMFTALDKQKPKAARDFIVKHHLDQPHIQPVLLGLAYTGDDSATELLKGVYDKNKNVDCQGTAAFALGVIAKMKAKSAGGDARKELVGTAMKQLTLVSEKFADVKAGHETLGKMAASQLLGLKMMEQLQVGKAVPEISGEDLDGKPLKLSEFKGKVTVVSFWATWCPPCMALVPHEIALLEGMKGRPFALVGVNGDELDETVRKRIADKKITWRSFKNEQKGGQPPLSDVWDIEGWPTIYVIDSKGIIQHVWSGSPGEKVMDEAIEKLVKQAEGK